MAYTVQANIAVRDVKMQEHGRFLNIWAFNNSSAGKQTSMRMEPHHTAVSARISQCQAELSGQVRVHAELQAQRVAARSR